MNRPLNPPNPASAAPQRFEDVAAKTNLTNSQVLIWIGQKLNPDRPLYNMVLAFSIAGELQPQVFEAAFQTLVAQSDALRTVIREEEGVPQRVVLGNLTPQLAVVDLTAESDPDHAAQAWVARNARRLFDLEERLFDTALLKLAPARFVWYLNQHHLITDGWATALVYRRMADLYGRLLEDRLPGVSGLPQFEEYARYERAHRATPKFQEASEYWRSKLADPLEPTRFYGAQGSGSTTRTDRVYCDLGAERSGRLKQVAMEKGVRSLTLDLALLNIFLTVLLAYLHRISGKDQLRLGAPFHNRIQPQFRETIGLFIEICLLAVDIEPDETFASLLKKVQQEVSLVMRHAQPGTTSSVSNRAYDVLLNYINASFPDFAGIPVDPDWVHPGHGDSNHMLRLQVHDFGETGDFVLAFDLSIEVFDDQKQELAIRHFLRLLDGFLADRTQAIGAVPLLSDEEQLRLLEEPNRTASPYPRDKTVVALFEEQAQRTPHAVAANCNGQVMSYSELNTGANQLARYLQARGLQPGGLVGLYLERSLELLVGILGVLKAGGAYVPIESLYPQERVGFMLEDMAAGEQPGPAMLLTHERLADKLPEAAGPVVIIDREWDVIATLPGDNLPLQAGPHDLVYVIYTSGSTGKPKGVMIEHRGLVNYLWWGQKMYVDERTRAFALFTSISFDLTVTSIFVPLISGGKAVVYPEDRKAQGLELLQVIEEDAVDIVKLTPSHLALMRDYGKVAGRVKKLIVGGEDFKTDLARAITQRYNGDLTIFNEYGPTETVVGCMIHRYDPAFDTGVSVSIGKPADNVQIYILDALLRPTPEGIVGEMYIAGDGVGRGYLNRPAQTAERFLENPFSTSKRMYRTGDLGRWMASGTIDFLGRKDHQVKIGGARIELGEVEAALLSHPDISECVVDVGQVAEAEIRTEEVHHCITCGLPSNLPGTTFDASGLCNWCQAFDDYEQQAQAYFRTMDDLRALLVPGKNGGPDGAEYDCLALISGGKDSTYMVYQLVEMGLRVLAFSLDNGYISEEAKRNVQRVVDDLGIDHVWGSTPAMNAIFVDSLQRFSNVCNGCFKTIYTLSMKLARQKGIKHIVTGLTKGQIFETRLEELFRNRIYDIRRIDETILQARKAYHRMYDAVAEHLDVEIFQDDSIFEDIEFVDFYRYSNVELEEIMAFLDKRAPWVRPSDTGRSTNCLINDAGIYVHTRERGFHNYAFPYSWDVRLGHKTRADALDELNDEIDVEKVKRMLEEIGYDEGEKGSLQDQKRLIAYYVSQHPPSISKLRTFLAEKLPIFMIPSSFIRVEHMPLTPNGKVDRKSLSQLGGMRAELEAGYVAPRNDLEHRLTGFWSEILKIRKIGVHDNFFELGGNSLPAIQFISRIQQEFQVELPIQNFFEAPTIAEAAEQVEDLLIQEIEGLSDDQAMSLLMDLE